MDLAQLQVSRASTWADPRAVGLSDCIRVMSFQCLNQKPSGTSDKAQEFGFELEF